MPSELFWKALEINFTSFRHLSKFPISFDAKKKEFHFDRNFKDHIWFYFNTFAYIVVSGLWGLILSLVLYLKGFNPKTSMTGLHCVIFVGWLILGGFVVLILMETFYSGEEMISYLNSFIKYHSQLLEVDQEQENHNPSPNRTNGENTPEEGKTARKGPTSWILNKLKELKGIDPIGAFLWIFVVELAYSPPIFTLFGMWQGFVPHKYIMEDILPPEIHNLGITQVLITVGTYLLVVMGVAEGFRILPLLMIFMAFPVQLYLESIQILRKMHSRSCCDKQNDQALDQLHKLYTGVRILSFKIIPTVARQTTGLYWMSQFFIASLIFASIRLYDVLPLPNYLMGVFATIWTTLLTFFILGFGLKVHEQSSALVDDWRGSLNQKQKYYVKKFKSLRPILLNAGLDGCVFMVLKKSVRNEYVTAVVDQTINRLITITDTDMQKLKSRIVHI